MFRTDFLKPLNDIAYCCECAAQDYTGELKTELSELCQLISKRAPGYEAPEVQGALHQLERALECFRTRDKGQGTMILTGVSRGWWAAVDKPELKNTEASVKGTRGPKIRPEKVLEVMHELALRKNRVDEAKLDPD